jgi:hypothetical protein
MTGQADEYSRVEGGAVGGVPPVVCRPSWTIASNIAAFVAITGALLFSPVRSLLTFLFPALAFLCAVFLYVRSKPSYTGFVVWIWFLTPFVRRVVDQQAGGEQAILLAPYLVAAVAGGYLLRNLHLLATIRALPFVCALGGILYGLCIGGLHFSPVVVGQALCEWLVPVIFAFFLFSQPDEPERVRRSFLIALGSVLILSAAYAIVQFYWAPSWDMTWLSRNQDELVEIGPALATQFRVFGTMNSPTVLGVALMTGLLLLPLFPKMLRSLFCALGVAAILLTVSRSAWFGFAAGLIFLFAHANSRRRVLLLAQLGILVAVLFAFLNTPVFSDFLTDRFNQLADIQSDASYGDRIEGYQQAVGRVTREPFGEGLGSAAEMHTGEVIGPHDSSFLESLYSLGWLGTLLYAAGLFLVGVAIFRPAGQGNIEFIDAGRAVFIAFVAQSPLNSIMLGQAGFIMWAIVALTVREIQQQQLALANLVWRPVSSLVQVQEIGPLAIPESLH